MATWQCWWRTSEFPVTDKEAFAECFAALGLEGQITEQANGALIVGTSDEGVDNVPLFDESALEDDAVQVMSSNGLEDPEEATIFSVIAHFLPDDKSSVSLISLDKLKMAELGADAWVWSKDRAPETLHLWDAMEEMRIRVMRR